ncbi:hypothetical protein FACS1894166_01200 [Bacilli bacterium]|nr:hypothetical protein FACS1894166_01200 [Bacilli bacterium]
MCNLTSESRSPTNKKIINDTQLYIIQSIREVDVKSFKKISSLIGLILLGGGASAIPLITGCAKGGPHGVVQFDSFSRYEKYVKR